MRTSFYRNGRVATIILLLIAFTALPMSTQAGAQATSPESSTLPASGVGGGSWVRAFQEDAAGQRLSTAATCTLPAPPLVAPEDGTQVTTLTPEITWQVMPNTIRYQIEFSPNATFSPIEFISAYLSAQTEGVISTVPFDNLRPNTTYYWRVASVCTDTRQRGAYSAARRLRTGPEGGALPGQPSLLAPADSVRTASIRVAFTYTAVPTANRYQIRLYRSLADAQANRWWRIDYSDTTHLHETFEPEQTQYWMIGASNDDGWGLFSSLRSLTTPEVSATGTITPAAGGTLTPDPGTTTIQFPAGTVGSTTTLSYTLMAEPDQRLANWRFGNRAFTLKAFSGDTPVTTFSQPFTITLDYDLDDLRAAGIGDPTLLNLLFWNGTEWVPLLPCAGCSNDTQNRRITAVLDHLTEFALAASVKTVYLPMIVR
ncbi:MAG: hypothetical protein AB4911_17265 [Oscillochloridaceae bacterium umkhey_bin13]